MLEGGCYCGRVRYEAAGKPMLRAQCHCRPCQYFSGGAANMFMLMPPEGFRYTKGEPRQFKRDDLETRSRGNFVESAARSSSRAAPAFTPIILKAGTLDDPSQFGVSQMAINTKDRQAFNCIQEGLPTFEELPPR